jgi:hypothetical protein
MTTKKILAIFVLFIAFVVCLISSIIVSDFWSILWDHIYHDFWPLDASRVGPNLVAAVVQWLLVGLIASVFYPPLRHWIERELDHLHVKLDHAIQHNPNVENLPDDLIGRIWSVHNKKKIERD